MLISPLCFSLSFGADGGGTSIIRIMVMVFKKYPGVFLTGYQRTFVRLAHSSWCNRTFLLRLENQGSEMGTPGCRICDQIPIYLLGQPYIPQIIKRKNT